jgi:hypothetical protein
MPLHPRRLLLSPPRVALLLVAATIACARGEPPRKATSEQDKAFYALGYKHGRSLEGFRLSDRELALVEMGLTDLALKREPAVDLGVYGPKIDALARKRGPEAGTSD